MVIYTILSLNLYWLVYLTMDKRPLILWSGGLDSTLCVWNKLKEGISVDVVYIELENNETKVNRERAARSELKKIFHDYFCCAHYGYAQIVEDITIKIPAILHNTESQFIQPHMWANWLLYCYNSDIHSHIETGYIKEDDFWHIRHNFDKYIEYGNKAFFVDRKLELRYPLEWISKKDVVDKYLNTIQLGKDLFQHTTWCESILEEDGKFSRSCSCVPCQKMYVIDAMFRENKPCTTKNELKTVG